MKPSLDRYALALVEKTGFQPDAQIFVEPDSQIGFALRLVQKMEGAGLALVVGAGQKPGAGAHRQLAIGREAVAQRGEARYRQIRRRRRFRQALVAARYAGRSGHVTEAQA